MTWASNCITVNNHWFCWAGPFPRFPFQMVIKDRDEGSHIIVETVKRGLVQASYEEANYITLKDYQWTRVLPDKNINPPHVKIKSWPHYAPCTQEASVNLQNSSPLRNNLKWGSCFWMCETSFPTILLLKTPWSSNLLCIHRSLIIPWIY